MTDQTPEPTEPEDAGQEHDVPADLMELHAVLELQDDQAMIGHVPPGDTK